MCVQVCVVCVQVRAGVYVCACTRVCMCVSVHTRVCAVAPAWYSDKCTFSTPTMLISFSGHEAQVFGLAAGPAPPEPARQPSVSFIETCFHSSLMSWLRTGI